MFLTQFSMYLVEGFVLVLIPYTLEDQYHVRDVATISGDQTAICEVLCIILDICVGFVFDLFGRRILMASAYFLTAIGLFILPFHNQVYPWFLISRLLICFSTITVNCPFIPDYIHERSQGLCNGYFLMVVSLANIISQTALLSVSETVDARYIYLGGALFILVVAILIWGYMKDVKPERHETVGTISK